jgi:hypothetical protein
VQNGEKKLLTAKAAKKIREGRKDERVFLAFFADFFASFAVKGFVWSSPTIRVTLRPTV